MTQRKKIDKVTKSKWTRSNFLLLGKKEIILDSL